MKKILLLFVACSRLLLSEAQLSPYTLQLRSGYKTPSANIDAIQWPRFMQQQVPVVGIVTCLLQFESVPTQGQIKELAASGIVLDE